MTFAFVRNNSGTRELAGGQSGIIYPKTQIEKQLLGARFVNREAWQRIVLQAGNGNVEMSEGFVTLLESLSH